MQVNSINSYNYQKNNKVNFGSVIPFRVKINNAVISQTADNQDMVKGVSYKLARLINGTTELGKAIKAQLQAVDKGFDGNFRTIRKGHMTTALSRKTSGYKMVPVVEERFFATGADAVCANRTGYQIGCRQGDDASRAMNLDNENELCKDIGNRIKGLKEMIINVVTFQKKKGTPQQKTGYKIVGVEFVKEPTPAPKKVVKKAEAPLTEAQTKLAKAGKKTQKKAKYNPNQQIFPFVPEIEKAQATKECRETVAKMWGNH